MSRSRIEVNADGELYTILPEEIVQELLLEDGETIDWYEEDGMVQLTFG